MPAPGKTGGGEATPAGDAPSAEWMTLILRNMAAIPPVEEAHRRFDAIGQVFDMSPDGPIKEADAIGERGDLGALRRTDEGAGREGASHDPPADEAESIRNPLEGLAEKTAADPGAPFMPEALEALAALKKDNRAAFESLRSQLKKAGCRVTALDEASPRKTVTRAGAARRKPTS